MIVSTRPDRPDAGKGHATNGTLDASEKTKLPMVVLVNQYSASASEIVSGALKDHHRAVIVGERTFGKGSVQMLYPLGLRSPIEAPDAVLKLTTSHYYLPDGKCIHREEDSKEWGRRARRDGRDDPRADARRHRPPARSSTSSAKPPRTPTGPPPSRRKTSLAPTRSLARPCSSCGCSWWEGPAVAERR